MTQNKEVSIEQMNEVIAVFCGYTIYDEGLTRWALNEHKLGFQVSDLRYHESWKWLMPVVEKIERCGYIVQITFCLAGTCKIWNHTGEKACHESNSPIDAVYQAVYHFITWYNTTLK